MEALSVTFQIVILAMAAAFLGLQLFRVLGRRAEHEEEPIQGRFDEKPGPGAAGSATQRQLERPGPQSPASRAEVPPSVLGVERGLREIAVADRSFDTLAFVEGARGAYRMILEAYWRGDKEELAQLCDKDVYTEFVAAIDAREAAGEKLDNRLIRIEDTTIVAARFDAPVARIAVRFSADIATVTRDSAGNVVAGSLDDAVESHDVWSFSRNVHAAGPDWLLEETDDG